MNFQSNPFHLVKPSPWPIYLVWSIFGFLFNLMIVLHGYTGPKILLVNVITLIYIGLLWSRDIISESVYLGDHTLKVNEGLNIGFIIFLITELMWFVGVFWAYFYSALTPSVEIGEIWPPIGIIAIKATDLPLFNTLLLLISGSTITYSHHALISRDRKNALIGLFLTIVLGVLFIVCQYCEYYYCSYTLADSVYGSVFFMLTGLHGLHLITGTSFLCFNFYRLAKNQFTSDKHVGLNTSILLWHFLDVAWLFVYIVCYYWGV